MALAVLWAARQRSMPGSLMLGKYDARSVEDAVFATADIAAADIAAAVGIAVTADIAAVTVGVRLAR